MSETKLDVITSRNVGFSVLACLTFVIHFLNSKTSLESSLPFFLELEFMSWLQVQHPWPPSHNTQTVGNLQLV
jgi:hypothetical protein